MACPGISARGKRGDVPGARSKKPMVDVHGARLYLVRGEYDGHRGKARRHRISCYSFRPDERLTGRQAAKDARRAESVQGLTQRAEAAETALAEANGRLQTITVQAQLSAERERELLDLVKAGAERERVLIEEVAGLKAKLAGIEHDQQAVAKLAESIGTLKAEVATVTKDRDT